jgi:catechol 2,3-dioxygenase-like lactoylglutathione lyase family enzyme
MKLASCFLLLAFSAAAQELPIARLGGVTFQVADLAKAEPFYSKVMGFERAFELKSCAFYRVNDDQYVEFCPGDTSAEGFRLDHVTMLTRDMQVLQHLLYVGKLEPSAIRKGDDRNLHCSITDPDGTTIDFVQYVAGSPQMITRPRTLGLRPVSEHLLHVGLAMSNEAAGMDFYSGKLGFREFLRGGPTPGEIRWINLMMPGIHGDYMELMVHTADPVKARQHLCWDTPDIQVAYKQLLDRGIPNRFKPFLAQNHHWIMNLRDPYGIRAEFMEPKEAK